MRARTETTTALAAALTALATLSLAAGPAQAAFPGENGRIAFTNFGTSLSTKLTAEIDTINADGSGQTRLVTGAAVPAFSPDGSKITFAAVLDRKPGIYLMNANGSGVRRLTRNAADNDPAFSPDGSKIAFASSRGSNGDIYTMNADGSGQRRLTTNKARDEDPVFSPDGSTIAFVSGRDDPDPAEGFSNLEIYRMNADGSRQTNLTRSSDAVDRRPDFSPDGTKIAFMRAEIDQSFEIYTMNADGSAQTNLTNNPAADFDPVFSPDGTKIAFATSREQSSGGGMGPPCCTLIYTMNSDGSAASRLTAPAVSTQSPAWQPRGLAGACANKRGGTENDDRIVGTAFGERILGLGGDDILAGRAGRDCLSGDAGEDRLDGGAGADRLDGGAGRDQLAGGPGSDKLTGGPGTNSYSAGPGNDSVSAANGRSEKVNCGPGRDKVRADRADRLQDCERVRLT